MRVHVSKISNKISYSYSGGHSIRAETEQGQARRIMMGSTYPGTSQLAGTGQAKIHMCIMYVSVQLGVGEGCCTGAAAMPTSQIRHYAFKAFTISLIRSNSISASCILVNVCCFKSARLSATCLSKCACNASLILPNSTRICMSLSCTACKSPIVSSVPTSFIPRAIPTTSV